MSSKGAPTYAEAEAKYSKAAKAELGRDLDAAFRLYLSAAEDFLHLARVAADAAVRAACKAEAGKALQRAENIRGVRRDVAPVLKDHFSQQQQRYVLSKSSVVNGLRFPLWEEDPSLCADVNLQPALSPEQERNGAVWQRQTRGAHAPPTTLSILPSEIVQHIVSDCSVCGGITVSVDHHRRFGSQIVCNSLHPPYPSPTGQYDFRVLFNGAHRRIRINDALPAYPDGTLMCMATGSKDELWPAFVEKAYMKLMGGYEFPGSDSSTDLHALAGWIPEHINIQSPDFQRERTWSRILQGYQSGKCVLTLGTGETISPYLDETLKLLRAHCYAVIDVQVSVDDERQLTILDSWVKPLEHSVSQEDAVQEEESSRTFMLTWDAVCDLFDGVYLSWNPSMFQKQTVFHGIWETTTERESETRSSHFRLQLQAERSPADSKDNGEVWFLLTRHIADTKTKADYIALDVQSASEPNVSFGSQAMTLKSEYTNGTHTLVRSQITGESVSFSLVAAYDGGSTDASVGFTITAYSSARLSWTKDLPKNPFSKHVDGAFTSKTSGGNYTHPGFMFNPQYHIRLYPHTERSAQTASVREGKVRVSVAMTGPRNLPMNATMVWSQGQRVSELAHNDVAASSGPYTYGHADITQHVPIGQYTLVLSAFDPRHLGAFSLDFSSSHRFDLEPIPQEGAGMFSKIVKGTWTVDTAMGSPTFKQYHKNPAYKIEVASQTQIMLRLQLAEPSSVTSLNVSLFPPHSEGQPHAHIATSGPYADAISGVVTPQVLVQPGTYLAVVSTYEPGIQRAFRLIVYSTAAGLKVSPVSR